ncbi:MAG: hypothetical protein KDK39_06505 [Leptospiraceae bacterium]|nr:hypothetical protein [Leptospiraceae bacterium]
MTRIKPGQIRDYQKKAVARLWIPAALLASALFSWYYRFQSTWQILVLLLLGFALFALVYATLQRLLGRWYRRGFVPTWYLLIGGALLVVITYLIELYSYLPWSGLWLGIWLAWGFWLALRKAAHLLSVWFVVIWLTAGSLLGLRLLGSANQILGWLTFQTEEYLAWQRWQASQLAWHKSAETNGITRYYLRTETTPDTLLEVMLPPNFYFHDASDGSQSPDFPILGTRLASVSARLTDPFGLPSLSVFASDPGESGAGLPPAVERTRQVLQQRQREGSISNLHLANNIEHTLGPQHKLLGAVFDYRDLILDTDCRISIYPFVAQERRFVALLFEEQPREDLMDPALESVLRVLIPVRHKK